MGGVDWHEWSLERLAAAVRETRDAPDGERTIWAFEHALAAARVDDVLLRHLLVAATCLIAHSEGSSPRAVLETFSRRCVSDDDWRTTFRPLFA